MNLRWGIPIVLRSFHHTFSGPTFDLLYTSCCSDFTFNNIDLVIVWFETYNDGAMVIESITDEILFVYVIRN